MKKFSVIDGGKRADHGNDRDWRAMWKQLTEIEQVLHMRRNSSFGPRGNLALLGGFTVLGCIYGLEYLARRFAGLSLGSAIADNVAAMGGAVLTFFLVRRFSAAPLTYTDKLDGLLAEYEPLSKEAYRDLQDETVRFGGLDTDLVVRWVMRERDAIQRAAGWVPRERQFINKQV